MAKINKKLPPSIFPLFFGKTRLIFAKTIRFFHFKQLKHREKLHFLLFIHPSTDCYF